MDAIKWLQEWYKSNCDGDWEHLFGVQITTLDNPGWLIEIDLTDTDEEDKDFCKIKYDKGDDDWLLCYVKENVFYGNGDPDKFFKIIEIFKEWVEGK